VERRPITALELGDPAAAVKVLVIGCIHGNEPAGRPIARELETGPPIPGVDLWVVRDINPDGFAHRTRGNAHGVDLNRNFPYRWRPLERPGGLHWSGPRALSEPESRVAHSFFSRLKPDLTIWYHQPYGIVDLSGGDAVIERRYAKLTRMEVERLPRYPGSASTWQNARMPDTTAMVVELGSRLLGASGVQKHADAVRTIAAELAGAMAEPARQSGM
jgi:protein MpaA